MFSTTRPCPCCGRPTFRVDLRDVHGDVAALLGVKPGTEVARDCEARAERELDDAEEAIALASDPDFATVCDVRRDGWIASMELRLADAERTVVCIDCGKTVPWFAADPDGRCSDCPAARRAA